jgi:hypothetical protein
MDMGGMDMTGGQGSASTGAHAGVDLLPDWLAIVWTLIFLAILVTHARHVLRDDGQRRYWHVGHVLMAAGMIVMFAPPSIDPLDLPAGLWQLAFAAAAGLVLGWTVHKAVIREAVSVLWLVLALDLAAMVYMWSESAFRPAITWVLVTYFAAQAVVWVTNPMRAGVEGPARPAAGGAPAATATAVAKPLFCEGDLRVSLGAMTLGMAYMFAAMQLMA